MQGQSQAGAASRVTPWAAWAGSVGPLWYNTLHCWKNRPMSRTIICLVVWLESEIGWNGFILDCRDEMVPYVVFGLRMEWLYFTFGWRDEREMGFDPLAAITMGPTCQQNHLTFPFPRATSAPTLILHLPLPLPCILRRLEQPWLRHCPLWAGAARACAATACAASRRLPPPPHRLVVARCG
jgi:hypothetical protein